MRRLLLLLFCLCGASTAQAAPTGWEPIRVHVQCQGWGRTKACPAFLRGFIDQTPVLVHAPLARAQVVLYYNVTYRAGFDRVHLRLISAMAGAPREIEALQEIDSRASDDAQRSQLEPVFMRAVAPFVAAVLPEAVKVEFRAPSVRSESPPVTTPWGVSLWAGGSGSWTENYRTLDVSAGAGVSRVTAASTMSQSISGHRGLSRQPPLEVEGQTISLDADSYSLWSRTAGARNLDGHLALGGLLRAGHEDEIGRYRWTARAHIGGSYDLFPADDPRGNALELAYLVGVQADRYNAENERGELRSAFPTHGLLASGSVRRDTVTYEVRAALLAQLLRPGRRHLLEIEPSISIQLGAHLDVGISLGVTKQHMPGPGAIDPGDYEQVTRAGYAEPLRIVGNLSFHLHWDRSNPDRNNRWQATGALGELDTL